MASFDEAVPPGQAGRIRASLRTDTLRGAVGKSIDVRTNDPERPALRLVLRAEVRASVRLLPNAVLRVQPVRRGEPTGVLLVRKDPGERGELRVDGLRASVPWIEISAREIGQPETLRQGIPPAGPGDWAIEASVATNAPEGAFREEIVFRTGLEIEPEVRVPVVGIVPEAIRVAPVELELPTGRDEVRLRGTLRQDLELASLAVSSEGPIEAELVPSGPRHFEVVVRRTAQARSPGGTARVRLAVGGHEKAVPVRIAGGS